MIKELDVVRLLHDLPEYNLVAGLEGTVHQVFAHPPAYLVEFSDDEGDTDLFEIITLTPNDVELIWSAPPVPYREPQPVG